MKRSGPRKTYQGKINPEALKNPQKYEGDITKIVYRSLWERNVMFWLDENPNVAKWASEEIHFPYENPVTGKRARYFPDFYVQMVDGKQRIIEVKPKRETSAPVQPSRKTKKYLNEVSTWVVNQEKWRNAEYYCKKVDMSFEIWTEETLNEMGIMKARKLRPLAEKKAIPKANFKKTTRPRPKRKS